MNVADWNEIVTKIAWEQFVVIRMNLPTDKV